MIDFELRPDIKTSETQRMVYEAARDFATQFIKPNVMEWDEAQYFPVEIFDKAGALGFMGMLIPESYGGSGMGYHEYVTLIETISIVDPSIGLSIAAHNSLCVNHIYSFGTEEQRLRWLPKLCEGTAIGAWGLTEHNTGSDAKGMSTTAIKQGDQWILNGTKNFITHGISADIAVVIARSGNKGDSRGTTAFVVERGTPGFYSGSQSIFIEQDDDLVHEFDNLNSGSGELIFSISSILLLAAEKQGWFFDKFITFMPDNNASTVAELLKLITHFVFLKSSIKFSFLDLKTLFVFS